MEFESKIAEQLTETIKLLPIPQQELLLNIAQSLLINKRKHKRKTFIMYVDYSDEKRFERGIIQNISAGGIHIRPSVSLESGQTIIMTFEHPDDSRPIKLKGTIVWKNEKGMGIRFDRQLMLKSN
jgi:Tfp pilus assembly protein PilZ